MASFNIYCDESCHLENDKQQAMVLGAIWCQTDFSRHIARHLKEIKKKQADWIFSTTTVRVARPGDTRIFSPEKSFPKITFFGLKLTFVDNLTREKGFFSWGEYVRKS